MNVYVDGKRWGQIKPDHELKILPMHFEAVSVDVKRAEFRKNDRDFKAGDVLLLREWCPSEGYTGREVGRTITHITDLKDFIYADYVMLSLSAFPSWGFWSEDQEVEL